MIKIEWSYLTSPERLMEISYKLENKNLIKTKSKILNAKQIKNLEKLKPYYYAKSKQYNEKNPIASSNLKIYK
jgi:hypothetical protein